MKRNLALGFFLSVSLLVLLGCVQEPPPSPSQQCMGEGQSIPVIANPPSCCAGLELIPPKDSQIVGIMGYCTAKCGNGSCDEVESSNNCPEDCAGEQLVGPEAYGSEDDAFSALEEELGGIPDASADELEALLGS